MSDLIKRHALLESIRPLIEQLDSEGLDILQEWVQELKLARIRQAAGGDAVSPAPGGTADAREEFRELLREWDSKK